jgi:hypothetical protein
MEQLNSDDTPIRTLVPRIKALLQLASDLTEIFDDMLQESSFKPELANSRTLIERSRTNIENFRMGLAKAARDRDVSKVAFWSENFFSAYRYLSDLNLSSRSENKMLAVATRIDNLGRSIYGDIDRFDPKNLETMQAALRDF